MKKVYKMLVSALFALFCGLIGWQFGRSCGVEPQVKDSIPTIEDIQKLVGADPDGKLGPETEAKWNAALFNQYAERAWREANK